MILPKIIKSPKLIKSVPSCLTLTSLCLGLWSMRFTLEGNIISALQCILISICLDGMDGKLARYLGNDGSFGATLDTLADFGSFGIAPAFCVYYTHLAHSHPLSWLCVLFFATCMALRLARFTSNPAKSSLFFIGVPAPAGAFLCMTPTILSLTNLCTTSVFMHIFFILAVGYLLISKIPTFAITKFKISKEWMPFFSISAAMIFSTGIFLPWHVLLLISCIYILTFPFSAIAYKRYLKPHHQK